MYQDDHEEEISQSDVEPMEKVTINETSTVLSAVITPTCRLAKRRPRVAMNTPDQNANAEKELVFAMVLNNAKNRRTVAR